MKGPAMNGPAVEDLTTKTLATKDLPIHIVAMVYMTLSVFIEHLPGEWKINISSGMNWLPVSTV
jgi:hypothetical protein